MRKKKINIQLFHIVGVGVLILYASKLNSISKYSKAHLFISSFNKSEGVTYKTIQTK